MGLIIDSRKNLIVRYRLAINLLFDCHPGEDKIPGHAYTQNSEFHHFI